MSNLANNTESKALEKDIAALTNKLREEKPEVYKKLSENPIGMPSEASPNLLEDLKKYKETLENLLTKS